MKIDFKLSNLLGTVYRQGNLLFTPDGNAIISPVGNRISYFDLINNKSFTFSYEHRKNISRIALNPQATLLISVDDDGRAILVNFNRRTVIHHFNFKDSVSDIKFAPDGKHFAVAVGRHVQVWRTPDQTVERQFAPFIRHRIYTGHYADVNSITWSEDSRFFLTASKDLTAKVYSLHSSDSGAATTLAGHRDSVISSFFSSDQQTIYTVSKDGALFSWNYVSKDQKQQDEETDALTSSSSERWRITSKHYFMQDANVTCVTFHQQSNLLVVGFSSGIFALYELPSFSMIQSLSISQNNIDFVTINQSGEWLAFGASKLGQLLVWEWQSESYVLKQQGHFDSINALVYSPDGTRIVTGADDGKIKVWDSVSGFCIVTFTEHTSAVTALDFSKKGNVLFSSSLDGSVRAWDLVRYRNFRTFTSEKRVQFSSVAVDPSGEVVCAGSLDEFDIHLWSVQTSQLLDRLSGHEGPISSLSFGNEGGILASGSWDRTTRVWSIFGRSGFVEPLQLQSDVLAIAMRPDSKQVAVSTLDGLLTFWDMELGKQEAEIDGRNDISGGRHSADRFTASNSQRSKYFNSLCYSADGSCILAGGNSRFICLYDINNQVLLRKFTISKNMAIEGTLDFLNSKNMTEAGPLNLIDTTGEQSDLEDRIDNTLPGASRGDLSVRKVRPQIRIASIKFSPTGRSFSASSTEGLLIYSVDELVIFDPFDLDIDITVETTSKKLQDKEYLEALVMAFRLSERKLIQRVYESVPINDIQLICRDLPEVYLERMLRFVGSISEESPHVEFNLLWIQSLLSVHGRYLLANRQQHASVLRAVQKFVTRISKDLVGLSSMNIYNVRFLQRSNAISVVDSDVRMEEEQDEDEEQNGTEEGDEDDEQNDVSEEEGWFGPESKSSALSLTDKDGPDEESEGSEDEVDEPWEGIQE